MTAPDIDAIEAAARAAAEQSGSGMWVRAPERADGTAQVYSPNMGPCRAIVPVAETSGTCGAFIAALSPDVVLAMVAELRAGRALAEAVRDRHQCRVCQAALIPDEAVDAIRARCMRARWQCFGCGTRYRRSRCAETCVVCGRAGYWTGSVDNERGEIRDESPDVETLALVNAIDAARAERDALAARLQEAERERDEARAKFSTSWLDVITEGFWRGVCAEHASWLDAFADNTDDGDDVEETRAEAALFRRWARGER